jgi:hypothetical protein
MHEPKQYTPKSQKIHANNKHKQHSVRHASEPSEHSHSSQPSDLNPERHSRLEDVYKNLIAFNRDYLTEKRTSSATKSE